MKYYWLLFTIFLSLNNIKAAGVIHVLYGDLKSGQASILDRVFRPRLQDLAKQKEVREIKENSKATVEDLTNALNSPETLGIIFLGHPAIKTEGEMPDKKIIHGFLKDGLGRYLPKDIFSGAHKNLKFISIMTCHESAVVPLYLNSIPDGVQYYESPTHNLNSLGNPLFEFTSFYSTPRIIEKIAMDLEDGHYSRANEQVTKNPNDKYVLKIKLKDLVSQKFGYTVTLNGRYIGALFSKSNNRGRLLNDIEYFIEIPSSFWSPNNNIFRISPDDPHRPRPENLKVIDDILIDEVSVLTLNRQDGREIKRTILTNGPIHLGDQDLNPDMGEGLGFLRNQNLFNMSERFDYWEVVL